MYKLVCILDQKPLHRLLKAISFAYLTFGSDVDGVGDFGSGKSPMKRRIVVHIARAAYGIPLVTNNEQFSYLSIIIIS